jgi:hypothetical protein
MESFLAWLAGAVAVGTAAIFAPKKKRNAAAKGKSASVQPVNEHSDKVIPMAKKEAEKKAKKTAKPVAASKKSTRAAQPSKARSTKAKPAAKAKTKTPTAIRKPRKRKAS